MIQSSFKYFQKNESFYNRLKSARTNFNTYICFKPSFSFFPSSLLPWMSTGLSPCISCDFDLFKLLMHSLKINFSNRSASVLHGSQIRAGSAQVKVQASFHGEGSSLKDIALESKEKCLSSLLDTLYQSCRLFQMTYFYCSSVTNVHFHIN